ncbi:hypothetical protein ACIL2U_001932 [Vibrio alginolyticus]
MSMNTNSFTSPAAIRFPNDQLGSPDPALDKLMISSVADTLMTLPIRLVGS